MTYFTFIFLVFILIKIYHLWTKGQCKSKVCLNGKTVIVTGSNTGIGFETALEFAKRGAKVILACRNLEKANEARDKIISLTENKNVVVKELNLASLKSVKNFAKDINENEERLDILVNNAGAGLFSNKNTEDGLKLLMQVNYFGPVLLTLSLLDLLRKTDSSRIINVSSMLAYFSTLRVQDLNTSKGSIFTPYWNSKLALILFTIKLSKLLKRSSVTVYSLHPGVVDTLIFRHVRGVSKIMLNLFSMIYFKTPEEGAQTTLHTALEQGIEKHSGKYFKECGLATMYRRAEKQGLADEIWEETVKLIHYQEEVDKMFG